jgi:protein pelota
MHGQLLTPVQSQAIIAGPHIFVSGQLPADASGKLIEGSIADKTTAVCENLKAILEDAGSSLSRVVEVGPTSVKLR